MTRSRFLLGFGLVLLLLGACAEGETGDQGNVLVNFHADASVSEVTLTGVGIDVAASLPDPAIFYRRNDLEGRVEWRSGGNNYFANVSIEGDPGDKGKKGLLPPETLPCGGCPPLVGEKGSDGEDKRHTLLFTGTRALHFRKLKDVTGT